MSLTEATATATDLVSRNLRVPEYKYATKDESEFCELIDEYYSRYELQRPSDEPGLNALRLHFFADKEFPTRFINLVFLVDRCFDVWLRKAALDEDIVRCLTPWRLILLRILYREGAEGSSVLPILTRLLDEMSHRFRVWCINPERARKQVPEMIDAMRLSLSGAQGAATFEGVLNHWDTYLKESESKADKIRTRLVNNEQAFVSNRYCGAVAQHYLNEQFKAREVSSALQQFLEDAWLAVLKTAIEQHNEASVPDDLHLQTRKIRAVFCDKGKAAFQYGEPLVEQLQEYLSRYSVSCPEDALQALVQDTIAILKKEPISEQAFQALSGFESLSVFEKPASLAFEEGDWFLDPDKRVRMQVLKHYADYAQVLMVNYLGMKLEINTVSGFSEHIQAGKLKKLAAPVAFSAVLGTTANGLQKVAETQLKAREKAAEKARLEAQRLRKEQELAAENARQKAAEIARRTRELANKKDEAKRLEGERKALELISKLSLGAWISIDKDGDKQRFKLAVKFAAKKRYVFVDKYGVKKVEFDESALVTEMTEDRLQVLNDGADFDDSLERVIGRMRMSR